MPGSLAFTAGYIIGGIIFGGLIGAIGGYIAYRSSKTDEDFWSHYQWKPWLSAAALFTVFLALSQFSTVLGWLGIILSNIASYLLVRNEIS